MSLTLLQSEQLAAVPGVIHAFTDRQGGVSEGIYASSNLAQRVGEDRVVVDTNRRKVLDAIGRSDARLVFLRQVHGDDVVEVNHLAGGSIEADGLWTRDRQAVIGVLVADCVPILVAHRSGAAVAAVHAGWRGTRSGVIARTLERMEKQGFAAADMFVALGPAIGPCCYEIGSDVGDALRSALPESGDAVRQRHDGTWVADLWSLNRQTVMQAGVPGEQVQVMRTCTSCTPNFYSHRREDGKTGRQAGIIGIGG